MKRYVLLLKKQILCFAIILATTVTISVAAPGKFIDFKLSQKPASMSTYEWCKKMAESHVNVKLVYLLTFMRVKSEHDWHYYMNKTRMPNTGCYLSVAMPQKIRRCVYNVFYDHEVIKAVKLISIREEYNNQNYVEKIVVETQNCGTIEVIATDKFGIGWTERGKHKHIIGLNPRKIERLELSDDSVEGIIGHELAHVIYDDCFKLYIIQNIFNESRNVYNLRESEQMCYEKSFSRAYEAEADIVGTFGNPRWARGLIDFFKKINFGYVHNSIHPTANQRIAYLEELIRFLYL
ncbi:hypothetical protein ACFLYA_00575 [Candidatus Dependentiae bacterium]